MRKPRRLVAGARYHVTARVNHQEMRLDDSASKALFMDTLRRAKCKYAFAVENFTIMGTHYHLLIRPLGGESLPKIMQWIMGVFAMAYNRIHQLKGHFWQDRYYSRIIESLVSLLEVFSYIDENPVKAGLVKNAWEWVFGGLHHHRTNRGDIVDKPDTEITYWLPDHQVLRLS